MMTMNKQSALRGAGTKCLVLVVTIWIACLTSTTTCFCLQGTRLSVPLVPTNGISSPRLARRHYYYYMSADGSSDNNKEESQQQDQEEEDDDDDDAAALQTQVDEMFPDRDDNQQEDSSLNLYNAAPLFTGGILTVVSIAFTAYLFYAGITGDDPLMGHSK